MYSQSTNTLSGFWDWFTPYLSVGQLPPGQEGYIVFELKKAGIKSKYKKVGQRYFLSVEKPRWAEAKKIVQRYWSQTTEPY